MKIRNLGLDIFNKPETSDDYNKKLSVSIFDDDIKGNGDNKSIEEMSLYYTKDGKIDFDEYTYKKLKKHYPKDLYEIQVLKDETDDTHKGYRVVCKHSQDEVLFVSQFVKDNDEYKTISYYDESKNHRVILNKT